MPGYFDPNMEAQMLGQQLGQIDGERWGRKAGLQAGQQAGYDIGYSDGKADGYATGWNEAIDVGNREIIKQLEITARQANEKQRLETENRALRELIFQFHTQLNQA